MKKWLSLLLAVLLLLSGCSVSRPTGPETTAPVPAAASEPETEETPAATEAPTEPPTDPPMEPGGSLRVLGEPVETFRRSGDDGDLAELGAFAGALGRELTEKEGRLFLEGEPLSTEAVGRTDGIYVPVSDLTAELGLEAFADGETTYLYQRPGTREELPQGIYVPILMYHAVGDDVWGIPELFVGEEDMEAQLQYLADNGYTPIFFSDLNRAAEFEKPVILTFDDGYDDNYTVLFPLIQKYGMKVNIAVITDYVGWNHKMTEEQIREMQASGLVSFLSHTATHPMLTECSQAELEEEMDGSRRALLRLTGTLPTVLVYPYGDNDAMVQETAARYYDMGVIMTDGSCYVTGDEPYTVTRFYVSRYTGLEAFGDMVSWAGTAE